MARPNLTIVLCVSLGLIFGSSRILYAQIIHIVHAHIANAHLGGDPCAGQPVGGTCTDGAIYAGTGYSSGGLNPALHYMVTPGGCTDEVCTGAGGTDSVLKSWANGSGTTANNVVTGAADANNGKLNTAILVNYSPYYTDTDAAHWCSNMHYGGYTNWYLPSQNELNYVLYNNKAVIAGLPSSGYWSSKEGNATFAWAQSFNSGIQSANLKTNNSYVRCARSY